ncbi:MAG: hypothetical protein ACWGQW_06625 [bacterium]
MQNKWFGARLYVPCALFLVSFLGAATTYAWVEEAVDATQPKSVNGYTTAITVDSSDKLHICYTADLDLGATRDDRLYYATNASGSWVITEVASDANYYVSLALDNAGNVHIAYQGTGIAGGLYLWYATNSSGSWITEQLTPGGEWAYIALDSSTHVHICHVHHLLQYTTNASGSWVTTQIHDRLGGRGSIAVDSSDKVHVLWDVAGGVGYMGIDYLTNASGSWVTETIVEFGGAVSMALDSSDKIHFAYMHYSLMYANNTSGSWVTTTVDPTSPGGEGWPLIALDDSGKAYIGYGYENNLLRYATNASGTWISVPVSANGWWPSIAVDSQQKVHMAYKSPHEPRGLYHGTNDCVPEVCNNGVEDDCDGLMDCKDSDCPPCPDPGTCAANTAASTLGVNRVYEASDLGKHMACFLLPLATAIGLRIWRKKGKESKQISPISGEVIGVGCLEMHESQHRTSHSIH